MITMEQTQMSDLREMLDEKLIIKKNHQYGFFGRVRDIIFSLMALLVLWPVMLVIALLIIIDDPKGSPFFAQTRVGQNGKVFRFYKFRSMCVCAEDKLDELLDKNEMDGPVFKIKEDPRITRIGRFIRRTSIDELPQLINVLKGDMSVVGPRPALPREVAQYDAYQRQRLLVKPGITCFWQVQPRRNSLPFDEWVALDIKYIKERSVLTDLKILLKTVGAVLFAQGE